MAITAAEKARSGTREWVFQRVSNLSICLWGLVFVVCVASMDSASFSDWQAVFEPLWFKLLSTLTLLLVSLNSVLAGWQIGTDYVKVPGLNKVYMLVVKVGSAAYACTGLYILWGL